MNLEPLKALSHELEKIAFAQRQEGQRHNPDYLDDFRARFSRELDRLEGEAQAKVGPCIRCGAICADDAEFDVHVCKPRGEAQPSCPKCGAKGLLYECVACSASNYPPAEQQTAGSECTCPQFGCKLHTFQPIAASSSEGEPVAWYSDGIDPLTRIEYRSVTFNREDVTDEHKPLFADTPSSIPSECWRQAVADELRSEGRSSLYVTINNIEARASELAKVPK